MLEKVISVRDFITNIDFFEKILIFSKKILKLQEIKTIRRKSQSEPE